MPAAPKRAIKIPSTARGSERFNHLRRQHRHVVKYRLHANS